MKQTWFKKAGWIYLPIHPVGIFITLGAIIFMVPVCMAVFRNVHFVSEGCTKYLFMAPALLSGGSGLQKKLLNNMK